MFMTDKSTLATIAGEFLDENGCKPTAPLSRERVRMKSAEMELVSICGKKAV